MTASEALTVAVCESGEDAEMVKAYGVTLAGVVPVGMVTVTFTVPPAVKFGIAGEKVQGPAVAGSPLQARVTGPVNPLIDVRLKLVLATAPTAAVACAGVVNERPCGRTAWNVMACCWVTAEESVPTALMVTL